MFLWYKSCKIEDIKNVEDKLGFINNYIKS